jgi:hypothetical protein
MKLNESIAIQAAVMKQTPHVMPALLQLHHEHVSDVVSGLRSKGDIIVLTQTPMELKRNDPEGGYQTVVWHGITRSATKKTFIITKSGGKREVHVEAMP